MIKIKRVYDEKSEQDGFRILVDRLWPRGLSKESAHVNLWLKDIAPSDGLRKWFSHDPKKWSEFKKKYLKELEKKNIISEIESIVKEKKRITLLYGAKDKEHNNAVVLKEYLQK